MYNKMERKYIRIVLLIGLMSLLGLFSVSSQILTNKDLAETNKILDKFSMELSQNQIYDRSDYSIDYNPNWKCSFNYNNDNITCVIEYSFVLDGIKRTQMIYADETKKNSLTKDDIDLLIDKEIKENIASTVRLEDKTYTYIEAIKK